MGPSRLLSLHFFFAVLFFLVGRASSGSSNVNGNGANTASLRQYTEKGEIAQLAYSALAIEKDAPLIAFADPETSSAIILLVNRVASSLMSFPSGSNARLEHLRDEKLVTAVGGFVADGNYARVHLFSLIQNHRFVFGESPSLENLSSQMSSWITRGLYTDREDPIERPLALSLLLSTYCAEENRAKLVLVENSGLVTDRKYVVTGALSAVHRKQILSIIAESSTPVLSKVKQILNLLVVDGDGEYTNDGDAYFECCVVRERGISCKNDLKCSAPRDVYAFVELCYSSEETTAV